MARPKKSSGAATGKGKTAGKPRGGRKSKAESVTGAKEAKVEVRKGELDLQQIEIASNDFQYHMKAIRAATEKKDTANNLLRGCYKAAKQVHPKLGKAIKDAIQYERADDDQDLRDDLQMLGIILREIESPIQITLHDTLLGDVLDVAFRRGKKDAENEKMSSSPYPVPSDLDERYRAGWESVMASRVTGGADLLGPEDKWPENGTTKLRQEAAAAL